MLHSSAPASSSLELLLTWPDLTSHAFTPRPLEEYYPNFYPTFEEFLTVNYPESPITAANLAARSKALATGFSCSQCGMPNSRVEYHGWYCRNTECRDAEDNINPFSYRAPHQVFREINELRSRPGGYPP